MTTKDQERAALAKIRKIVEGLGEDSYIVAAFDGCFEDAEYNIENDFACSFKSRYERCMKEVLDMTTEVKELKAANAEMEKRAKYAEDQFNRAQGRIDNHVAVKNEWIERYNEKANENKVLTGKVEAMELEIMKLKARLFDMMEAAK